MKAIKYKIIYSWFILFFLLQINGNSQSVNNKTWRQYNWFVGVSVGAAQTGISNQGTSVISEIKITKKNSICISFNAGYLFSKFFGLSTGIGVSPYFTELSLDSYSNSLDTIDSENEFYKRRISGKNIKESQKIYFLEIPLMINFQYPMSNTNGFYLQCGINLSIPVVNNYSNSGTYSFSGYYPAYNVLLTDIPYEGLKSNVDCDASGELKIKTINPELVASGGYYLYPDKRFRISLGFFYKRIFADISGYSQVSSFQLSTYENRAKSFMEGSEKATTSSMGIVISLIFFVK